jgi:hypothetical protein
MELEFWNGKPFWNDCRGDWWESVTPYDSNLGKILIAEGLRPAAIKINHSSMASPHAASATVGTVDQTMDSLEAGLEVGPEQIKPYKKLAGQLPCAPATKTFPLVALDDGEAVLHSDLSQRTMHVVLHRPF